MSLLETTIASIQPANEPAAAEAATLLDTAFPGLPADALGALLLRYLRATGKSAPEALRRCTILCCADHGVAAEGVSAYPPETAVQMTANYLLSQGAAANAFAAYAASDLLVVDLGIAADTGGIPGLVDYKIARGTKNMAQGPAMTRDEARRAVEPGIKTAAAIAAHG